MSEHLFKVRSKEEAKPIDDDWAQIFHTTVAQLLFVTTLCRWDVQTAVASLCTQVREPDKDDWKKLKHLLQYLKGTKYWGCGWMQQTCHLLVGGWMHHICHS